MSDEPFGNQVDLETGRLGPRVARVERRLSAVRTIFRDRVAADRLVAADDPLVYEVFHVPVPEEDGHLQHCASVVHPGDVGGEFYMTVGHFHARRAAAEVYLCLAGRGLLLLEEEKGRASALEMQPGTVSYIPPGWAHRSVNVGREPLVFFAVYPGNAGHDYAALQGCGFARLVLREGDGYRLVDNPARAGRG